MEEDKVQGSKFKFEGSGFMWLWGRFVGFVAELFDFGFEGFEFPELLAQEGGSALGFFPDAFRGKAVGIGRSVSGIFEIAGLDKAFFHESP